MVLCTCWGQLANGCSALGFCARRGWPWGWGDECPCFGALVEKQFVSLDTAFSLQSPFSKFNEYSIKWTCCLLIFPLTYNRECKLLMFFKEFEKLLSPSNQSMNYTYIFNFKNHFSVLIVYLSTFLTLTT